MKSNCEFGGIHKLVEGIIPLRRELARQAIATYQPEVEAIIHENCRDTGRIEQALTWMLDAAFDEKGLQLYKKLCRHYYFINPQAAAAYVHYYREMWDNDCEQVSDA
jgi:hypothetical protein